MTPILTLAVLLGVIGAAPAAAQTQAPPVEVFAGVERLTYRYRFENDSTFDTPTLVPHFFEQRYERDGALFGVRARYRASGRRMQSVLQLSPETRAFGSDFDTFFQPSGDRVTSGTAGDVDLATWRFEQLVGLGETRGAAFSVLFAYQRDRADFLPADRIVTHTEPASETREFITDRERTVSQTFEVGVAGSIRAPLAAGWQVDAEARLLPSIRARLLTQLPDKYPGKDIVFTGLAWSGSGRVAVTRRYRAVTLGGWVAIEQGGGYRQSAEFDRNAVSAGGSIAFGSPR